MSPFQDSKLLTESQILQEKIAAGTKAVGQPEQQKQAQHEADSTWK
jgi:hypothetical protein